MKAKILIVEDQFIEANNLRTILARAGYSVCDIAASVATALKIIERERPDFVLLDIFLEGTRTGIDLARILRQKQIAFVYLSANSNTETLEAAKATYPYGFLIKPFRERDVLVMLEIAEYLHENSLESVQRKTTSQPVLLPNENNPFTDIIGKSQKMQDIFQLLLLVALTDTSVLILGETGTGKEKIADAIHQLSPRKDREMVKINCAALPPTLIESVLFGHEKGSFTGAQERRIGKFEQATGGTLFLDEIGELSLEMQSKLLRALQEKEIERVGGNKMIPVDVRIVTATNINLEIAVAEGRFRMDLYYRLYVFPILLPPLRERKEDIPALVTYFLQKYGSKLGKPAMTITNVLLEKLINSPWTGNIRELEHTIERAVVLSKETIIKSIASFTSDPSTPPISQKTKTIDENERDHIIAVLKQCNGKVFGRNGAAEILGINYSTLHSRMKKLGIDKSKYNGKKFPT